MSFKIKEEVYIKIIGIIPVLQITLDSINLAGANDKARMVMGAVFMGLLILVNGFKIYFDPAKSNNGLWVTLIMAVGYVLGGILDAKHLIPISESVQPIIRTAAILLTTIGAYISNAFFNKDEADNS